MNGWFFRLAYGNIHPVKSGFASILYMKNEFNWNGEIYSSANSIQSCVGERLIETVRFLPDLSVLDAGCGSGNLKVLLAKKVPYGHVLGIDSSESMIKKAKESMAARGVSNLKFQKCGINEIEFEKQFDLIFSNSVLHWVVEIEDGLCRLFRAMKKGGDVTVQFPVLNAEHPLIKYARRAINELGFHARYECWHSPWYVPDSREQFIDMMKDVGFSNVEASMESNLFSFPSAEAVYQHFNSVGLELMADLLNDKEREFFFHRVMSDLKHDFSKGAVLRYERIFAKARKE